ncbi:MAG TPA: VOC family protein [Candidatus Acidoferrum sp.]|nr:VOC family protein [Candidatus Acidoferrum sp.]
MNRQTADLRAPAKPRLSSAAPTFLVDDVGKTARWYETNLGFTVSPFPKNEPYVYASLQRDGVELMLLRMEGYQKPAVSRPGRNWDAYIRMEGVHPFYEAVRQRLPIRQELVKRPYGDREFEICDPNGYVLVFSE